MSELVTNSVLHARSPAELTMRLLDGQLWVGVSDANAGPAVRKRYGPDAGTGRGLLLVERIATAWGTEPSGTGKLVWFQLASGAGESAMAGAESEFAADLADLMGDLGAGGGAPRPPRRGSRARQADESPADARHRWANPRASRRPTQWRTVDRTVERTPR